MLLCACPAHCRRRRRTRRLLIALANFGNLVSHSGPSVQHRAHRRPRQLPLEERRPRLIVAAARLVVGELSLGRTEVLAKLPDVGVGYLGRDVLRGRDARRIVRDHTLDLEGIHGGVEAPRGGRRGRRSGRGLLGMDGLRWWHRAPVPVPPDAIPNIAPIGGPRLSRAPAPLVHGRLHSAHVFRAAWGSSAGVLIVRLVDTHGSPGCHAGAAAFSGGPARPAPLVTPVIGGGRTRGCAARNAARLQARSVTAAVQRHRP
mmetsp:Transcript_86653/g.250046  ORF Transcript_86653/g.250046 Transcript_86653/m.250046 type:complete len:259 (+) Transcript_86653:330-1106(+)